MNKLLHILILLSNIIGLLVANSVNNCEVELSCPIQPIDLNSIYNRINSQEINDKYPGINQSACIFSKLKNDCFINSHLETFQQHAVPASQGWSICKYCIFNKNTYMFEIYRSYDERNGSSICTHQHSTTPQENSDCTHQGKTKSKSSAAYIVDLSWSLWGEFFEAYKNDVYRGEVIYSEGYKVSATATAATATATAPTEKEGEEEEEEIYYIDRPVFILPMITLHVGHVLVDLLEEIYFTMLLEYGEVRKDALICIDVAGSDERAVLEEKLLQNIYGGYDNVARILRFFTESPVLSVQTLFSFKGRVLFREVHVGMSIKDSFFHRGHLLHPCILSPEVEELYTPLSDRYKAFRDFIWSSLHYRPETPSAAARIHNTRLTFIQRNNSRGITNFEEIISVANEGKLSYVVADLFKISFTEQLDLFAKTDILIAVGGTGLHNSLFLTPGSAIVMIQPTGWCDFAWMFANQAELLGIHAEVYCDVDSDYQRYTGKAFHWTRFFWLQGPFLTKVRDMHINVTSLWKSIDNAYNAIGLVSQSVPRRRNTYLPHCTLDINRENKNNFIENKSTHFMHQNISKDFRSSYYFSSSSLSLSSSSIENPIYKHSLSFPSIRVFITSVKVNSKSDFSWELSVMGNVFIDSEDAVQLLQGFPFLSICVMAIFSTHQNWCYPIETFNYYSNLLLSISEPVQGFYFWLQSSSYGGKFSGSDNFVYLDLRLPNNDTGMDIHYLNIKDFEFQINVQDDTIDPSSSSSSHDDDGDGGIIGDSGNKIVFKPLLFKYSYSGPHSLQFAIADFCALHRISIKYCFEITRHIQNQIYRYKLLELYKLPSVQKLPSPSNPFVFLHIEKTAGTTLREYITESAESHSLGYFIPCHGDVHCVTVDLMDELLVSRTNYSNISVVAGHFSWGVWKELPSYRTALKEKGRHTDTDTPPSCFVMARHPIDRAISYYYQRCYDAYDCVGYKRRINELTPEELLYVAINERQAKYKEDNKTLIVLDEGISDAACRTILGRKITTGLVVGDINIQVPEALSASAAQEALSNVENCVVGLIDRMEETKEVVKFWFPWLDISREKVRKMHIYSNKETAADLREDLIAALNKVSLCDQILYDGMKVLFEKQLAVINSKAYFEDS